MNLALVCDVRLAGRSARFDTRFLQLGIHPGGGHTWMLQQIVGPQVAAAMVLFGEVLDGEQAERVGLAYRCVDDDRLVEVAHALAAKAADVPKELLVTTKQTMLDQRQVPTHPEAVDREIEPQVWSTRQPWFAERLAALQARISKKDA
jgi:enoyl-CoA hydratase